MEDLVNKELTVKCKDKTFVVPPEIRSCSEYFNRLNWDEGEIELLKVEPNTFEFLLNHLKVHEYKPKSIN
mgnify:CR=1 FL=1